jgi:flagellar biosynthesis protein FliP
MKYFLRILLIVVFTGIAIGFYVKQSDEKLGHLIIGMSLTVGVFILMPVFIYHRWKDRSVKDYMLTKESIEKMRNFQKDNKI